MPILVVCPGCQAKLNAPDAAAGKRVRCPRPGCGTLVPVAAAPPPVPPPAVRAAKPTPIEDDEDEPRPQTRNKARAVEDDDEDDRPTRKKSRGYTDNDDDDYEHDHRPTRKKKAAKGGSGAALVLGVGLVILLVLGGAGYGIYALVKKKKPDDAAASAAPEKAKVPDGWTEYKSDQDKFKAHFPTSVRRVAQGGGAQYLAEIPGGEFGSVIVNNIPGGTTPEERKTMETRSVESMKTRFAVFGATEINRTSATLAGQTVTEVTYELGEMPTGKGGARVKPQIVIRVLLTETKSYVVMFGSNAGAVDREHMRGFFDNFELLP